MQDHLHEHEHVGDAGPGHRARVGGQVPPDVPEPGPGGGGREGGVFKVQSVFFLLVPPKKLKY